MLKQTEVGKATRRKYPKVEEKKRKSADSRNKTRFSRTKAATNEGNTFRYEAEIQENTAIERNASEIYSFPEEKHVNEMQGEGELKVARCDFRKLRSFDKESIDDSLSMISLNSRPMSAVTDFAEEVKLESDEEFSSLEKLNENDQFLMRKISNESNSSDLKISVDKGSSPRIQGIENREESDLVDEETEKENSRNTIAILPLEEVEIIEEKENEKTNVKSAWELNEKFLLTEIGRASCRERV